MKIGPTTLHAIACVLLGGLLGAPPSSIAATAPAITAPTPASLATGSPVFSWTNGPENEFVSSIRISRRADLSSLTGGGQQLYPLQGLTRATLQRELAWGRWYWAARWKTDPDVEPVIEDVTPTSSFYIPGYLRRLGATYLQYGRTDDMSVRGSFLTNATAVTVTCTVLQGTRVVTRAQDAIPFVSVNLRMNYSCRTLSVPERLDGAPLTLKIVARGAGRTSSLTARFTAS